MEAEDQTAPSMAWKDANGHPRSYSLFEPEIVIGRHPTDEIFIDDPTVSRVHAIITLRRVRYYIEDQQSKRGTLLNGQPLTKAELLSHGDVITIGPVELTFQDPFSTIVSTFDLPARLPESAVGSGGLSVNVQLGKALLNGKELNLSPKEWSLLALLYTNRERSCTRDEIRAAVWPERDSEEVTDTEIDALVGRLRRKVEPDREDPLYVITVRSIRGFRFGKA